MIKRIQLLYLMFSIILFSSFVVLSLQQDTSVNRQRFLEAAKIIQFRLENFIQSQEKNLLVLDKKIPSNWDCTAILPLLQAYTFTHPQISAIAIKQSQKYCSTIDPLHADGRSNSTHFISGPKRSTLLPEEYFILHHTVNHRTYAFYLLASVLRKILHINSNLIDNVVLYNPRESLPIFSIKNIDRKKYSESLSQNVRWQQVIELPFTSKHNLRLQIYNNPDQSFRTFWYYELLQISVLLALIILVYILLFQLVKRRYSLVNAIRFALRNGDFFPVYQPLFDWRENRFIAVEVLLRCRDKRDKVLLPNLFIKEAERSGLIIPITRQIIKRSFFELNAWLRENSERHVAFNITKLHFNNARLFRYLKMLCKKYSIDPGQVMLELTERDLIDAENDAVTQRLQELRQAGFSLAIDDFGTGHASLRYLNHLPINYLKIDMMYVQAIGTNSMPATLIEPIIILAKKLKLRIVAEGVETEEQAEYLKMHGVDLLQGWFYAKTMSAREVTAFSKKKKSRKKST